MATMAKYLPSITSFIIVVLIFSFVFPQHGNAETFKLLPYQDSELGRNSHAYLPMTGITQLQQQAFVEEVTPLAVKANETWGVPASAIIAMAIIESGYGTTRIAHYANNLFGIKAWGYNPTNAWQLQGQPDEDFERAVPVLADYGADRKVYDETQRRDNWYREFSSYEESVNYLAGKLLLNSRYLPALHKYEELLASGMSLDLAANEYVFNIAESGYNHLGGDYYKRVLSSIMNQWNLYQYDEKFFTDARGHWAEDAIRQLAELHIIKGYPDKTFRPNHYVTKAQFVKMLVLAKQYSLMDYGETFLDVPSTHWSYPFVETGAYNNIFEKTSLFSPNIYITRGEMATMSARAMSYEPITDHITFTDVHKVDGSIVFIEAAAAHKIIIGYPDGTFRPYNNLTRAQAVTVISRMLNN
ncbi:Parasporal protein [Bacillus sp. HMF5848]|uniref:S-layer homology domain-containing protein n=1 Tax=Bacillus sp. HMF5848 TaxID=2495421 RepID=UPI000F78A2C3|nr:S-layer homology domain-containing protein [Bacillus sp. HMF5848]RSK26126.1 Parasporal protein [Bacillus sp. HMF5848]